MAASDLGTRIRRARERKGWTQPDLANELTRLRPQRKRPVGPRSVGRWERGETVPRDALGVLEAALAPYFSVNGTPADPPTDPRERELWDLATQDMPPAAAWEVIEEYRRRKRSRTA